MESGRVGGVARPVQVALLALWCVVVNACTPIHSRNNELGLSVSVDADTEARAELDDVEVVVESQTTDPNSWTLETSKRFTPDPSSGSGWPLAFRLKSFDANAVYQVRATSRDQAGAIIAQVRLIADPKRRQTRELELRFDRECLHRSELCSRSQTCSLGDCIDAHEEAKTRDDADGGGPGRPQGTDQLVQSARASDACPAEGALTCAMTTGEPLRCQQGMWHAEPACPDAMRCDATAGETLGTCQPIATECKSRKSGDRYCDADGTMLVCKDNQRSTVSPCGENERCVDLAGEVQCGCAPGFVKGAQGCRERVDCNDQGGCDPLTMCEMHNGAPVCTACPPGFGGKGETGCLPLLTGLRVSPSPLDVEFSPNMTRYKVRLPLLGRRITVTATTDAAVQLSIADTLVASGDTWTSPLLSQAQTTIAVTLRAAMGARNDYQIVVEHDAPLETYVKSDSGVSGGQFGGSVAAYGDTIVLGAPYESAIGPDGAVANAGAVHVYVRTGEKWELQQTLHSSKVYRDDSFGAAVAIWEDRIAVGSLGHDIFTALGTGTRDGSVEMFTRSAGRWQLQERLAASDAAMSGNAFGIALALHRDVLVVGGPLEDTGGVRSGEIYVFQWTGTKWEEQQHMKAPTPASEARFGSSFAIDDDLIAVSAPWEDIGANTRAGVVYTYERSSSGWVLRERLPSPTVRPYAQFGFGLALRGQTLAVGAPYTGVASDSTRSGEVYLFAYKKGADLVPGKVLEARYPRAGDTFGWAIALSETSLLVAAMGDSGTLENPARDSLAGSGAVYLYTRAEDGPALVNYLKASNAGASDSFGSAIALTDQYLVVSAMNEDGNGKGLGANAADESLTDSGAVYLVH